MPCSRRELEKSWYPFGLKIHIPLETEVRQTKKTTVMVLDAPAQLLLFKLWQFLVSRIRIYPLKIKFIGGYMPHPLTASTFLSLASFPCTLKSVFMFPPLQWTVNCVQISQILNALEPFLLGAKDYLKCNNYLRLRWLIFCLQIHFLIIQVMIRMSYNLKKLFIRPNVLGKLRIM